MIVAAASLHAARTFGIDDLNLVVGSANTHSESASLLTACFNTTCEDLVAVPNQVITFFRISDSHFVNTTIDVGGYRLVASLEVDVVLFSVYVGFELDHSPVPRCVPRLSTTLRAFIAAARPDIFQRFCN